MLTNPNPNPNPNPTRNRHRKPNLYPNLNSIEDDRADVAAFTMDKGELMRFVKDCDLTLVLAPALNLTLTRS